MMELRKTYTKLNFLPTPTDQSHIPWDLSTISFGIVDVRLKRRIPSSKTNQNTS